jgi:hypothetical protein
LKLNSKVKIILVIILATTRLAALGDARLSFALLPLGHEVRHDKYHAHIAI